MPPRTPRVARPGPRSGLFQLVRPPLHHAFAALASPPPSAAAHAFAVDSAAPASRDRRPLPKPRRHAAGTARSARAERARRVPAGRFQTSQRCHARLARAPTVVDSTRQPRSDDAPARRAPPRTASTRASFTSPPSCTARRRRTRPSPSHPGARAFRRRQAARRDGAHERLRWLRPSLPLPVAKAFYASPGNTASAVLNPPPGRSRREAARHRARRPHPARRPGRLALPKPRPAGVLGSDHAAPRTPHHVGLHATPRRLDLGCTCRHALHVAPCPALPRHADHSRSST